MKEFIEKLKTESKIRFGERADMRNIIDCKNYLSSKGIVAVPEDYFLFLRYANGLIGSRVTMFGVTPDVKKGFEDVVGINESLDKFDVKKEMIVGESSFDWLVYDFKEKEYQTKDKSDGFVVEQFADIYSALTYFLN